MSKSIIIYNVLYFLTLIVIVFFVGEVLYEKKKLKKIFGLLEVFHKKSSKKPKKVKIQLLKNLHNNLNVLLEQKNMSNKANLIFNIMVVLIGAFSIFLLYQKQVLLALVMPFVLTIFINKLVILSQDTIHAKFENQLPSAIDNIIRISTKYSDMKTIIYKTSKTLKEPLKGIFTEMAIQMNSKSAQTVLLEYSYKYDNVWFYSLVFTLISYIEDSNKDNTMLNLRTLRNLLEKENDLKRKSKTDKKGNIIVNRAIAVLAVIGFCVVMVILPSAKQFFFASLPGVLCFISGIAFLGITAIINTIMAKR